MKRFIILIFTALIGLSGCEKYNLKQPAYLDFKWKFNSITSSQGEIKITEGYFYSKEFSITGTRVKGSAVNITQSLPVQKVEFTTENELGISLDIPMGDYTEFTFASKIETSTIPSIVLKGVYHKGSEEIPVLIEWSEIDLLSFKILNPISFEKKKNYNVYIGFDVAKLFANVSSSLLYNGSISNEDGVPTLVIRSGGNNANLYVQITNQIPNAMVLTVE
jgi:hypothetical protein